MIPILLALPFAGAAILALPRLAWVSVWVDLAIGLFGLAIVFGCVWASPAPLPLLRLDRFGLFAAGLVLVAALGAGRGDGYVAKHIALGGMLLAVLAAHPLILVAALALSAVAALEPHVRTGRYRVPLAGGGLGLLLFGTILPVSPLAAGCAVLGLAVLAVAAPTLLPVLPLLAARYAGPELVALGLVAVGGCGIAAALRPARQSYIPWIALGQAGVVAVAFGLTVPQATFAALVLLALLVLSQAARNLATGDGLAALVASAGLAGLPPFGVFPGMALVVVAVAGSSIWLLPPLLAGIAMLGWASIRHLPPPRLVASDRWSAAWIPLVAVLLIGWCMPDALAAWLHAAATDVHR
jgi:hypothetical protein